MQQSVLDVCVLLKACGFQKKTVCFFIACGKYQRHIRHDCCGSLSLSRGGFIMACFLVPVAEAVVTTVITKAAEAKETGQPDLKAATGSDGSGAKSTL
jgi:hypothetical protein